ncbi:MAG: PDZ domain-containing protein, partial [Phycisphaerales bacterium]
YDETERGLLIGDVTKDGPADKAGLTKGDRIVMWNGEELPNVFAYMQALGGHKPGDVVRIGVERDGETIEMEVELEAWRGES